MNPSKHDVAEAGRRVALDAGFDPVAVVDAGHGRIASAVLGHAQSRDVSVIVVGSPGRALVLRSSLPWPVSADVQDEVARLDLQEAEEVEPWRHLLRAAADEGAACIVGGHRPASKGFASTAYRLVHNADRPVLVVPGAP